MRLAFLLFIALLALPLRSADAPEDRWERAIVTVEVTRKEYDYLQPWSRSVGQVQKMGTIIGEREILTTADYMADHTLIRLQKGRGRWFRGEVTWIDYHANLATITCAEEPFWEETEQLELAELAPRRGTAQLARWRGGILEVRNVDVNRPAVKKGKLTFIDLLHVEIDSEMDGIGWAEPILQEGKIVGIASSKEGNTITALPCSFIRTCLADRERAPYQGLGYFAFVWQSAENPDTLEYLGLEGEPRGVIVIEVPTNQVTALKPQDVILEIDEFKIDVQGDYRDPDYGNLMLEYLATREKRAGETVAIKIIRDGKEQTVDYKLPKADYAVELVPRAVFDQEPEYLIMGGLVFQPLTVPYLQSWGSDWNRKAPFRLSYAARETATAEDPSYIILSLVMPDPVNIGYQDARYLVVDKLNGKKVRTLQDLITAKEVPREGFHLFEFREGDSLQRLVLDAAETDAATERVLQRYGIQKDRSIASPPKSGRLALD